MKLISEQNFHDIECLEEKTEDGNKKLFISGIFMQANKKNRNGRIYEDKVLRPAVDQFISEKVETGKALGELEHPSSPQISLDRVSHKITNLEWNGDDIYGKALVLNTPTGNIVKGLIEGEVSLGVSSRGMGSIYEKNGVNYVKNDFRLATVDVVSDPSAPAAWVNGILEGVEFIFDQSGKLIQKEAELFEEKLEKKIKQFHDPIISERKQLKALQRFLSKL